ncbi:MAG: hypothetical protein P4K83_02235 [Terracidiphilus sp.]|nr:hypothetical protein [Terracidiphilus sp.]
MEIPNQIKCDECGRAKGETNHWLKSIEVSGYEGIVFMPAEAFQSEATPGLTVRDQCGQACAHKRLDAWLASLKNVEFPTKG